MQPFLKVIAEAYARRYGDLSSFRFVFPGKRSGTFFLKYLADAAQGRTLLAPEVSTVSDTMAELSGREPDSRIDLLFRLYGAYRRVVAAAGGGEAADKVDFDSFRSWGEVVLSDFSDVDMSGVDPGELFRNVRDFRDIRSDFLTDEQRAVMEEYFGVVDRAAEAGRFWKSVSGGADGRPGGVRGRFLYLWESLAPLYKEFNADLEAAGLSYAGLSARLACERVERDGLCLPDVSKVVFVGFNALTRMEWRLFRHLGRLATEIGGRREPMADFVWDFTGPLLTDPRNTAGRFLRAGIKQFPKPDWLDLSPCDVRDIPPCLRVVAAPSGVAQAKIVGEEIGRLVGGGGGDDIRQAKAAVVLPDENLLLPLLYSLPEGLESVNLTMGYPLRLTSAVSFVSLLRAMQLRARGEGGATVYLSEDVKALFAHPYLHAIAGSDGCSRLKGFLADRRRFTVPAAEVAGTVPAAAPLLSPLGRRAAPAEVIGYVDSALALAAGSLAGAPRASLVKARLDVNYINAYRDALRRLADTIAAHEPVGMEPRTVFALAARLVAGDTVNFEGEPLEGLQIMGLLETRSLDFDHLVIPSMNERVFPRRMRARSFVPEALRRAYGMPSASYHECIFAYYFYRLISRARTVTLIYDARAGGLRSADPSRYISQLRYLFAPGRVSFCEKAFRLSSHTPESFTVEKSADVAARLRRYTEPGSGYNFSASTLEHYNQCQMRFYFERVVGIRAEEAPSGYIDAATQGDILHWAMMAVYLPPAERGRLLDAPRMVTAAAIDALLAEPGLVERTVRQAVNHKYHMVKASDEAGLDAELEGHAAVVARVICTQVREVLACDREAAPFELLGCEVGGTMPVPVAPGLTVNMRYAIDRVDRVTLPDGSRRLRIVDYKTGGAHCEAESIGDLFSPDYKARYFFQLMLYANVLNMLLGNGWGGGEPVEPLLYQVQKMSDESRRVVRPVCGGRTVGVHTEVNGEFTAALAACMERLYDTSVPFEQTAGAAACAYCPFISVCRR